VEKTPALLVLSLSVACACSAGEDPGGDGNTTEQPKKWQDEFSLSIPPDLNADPHILEVDIEARLEELEIVPGVLTEMWTYNGTVPGPLLRASVGDRVIVHFTNHLAEPTTVHWHGLRVPAAMDGTVAVQDPVQPGETFTYDFTLLDAGTYWYHPHLHSSAQLGYGLYAPIVVDDPDDPVSAEDVVIVLSDLALDEAGQLDPDDKSGWFGDFFGQEGELLLVNGKLEPTLRVRPGLPQRWRIINAARSRFYGLAVPGAKVDRIAGDAGLSEHPLSIEQLVLHPSERSELLVTVNETDTSTITVLSQDVNRFEIGLTAGDLPLFHLDLNEPATSAPAPLPAELRHFEDLHLEGLATREIELSETEDGGLAINGVVFTETEEAHHEGAHTAAHVGYVGDTEIWEVNNTTEFAHPFHLHGFPFQVLDVGGQPWPVREWKDTANIPPGQLLRFVVNYDDRPGLWMFHCHILGHANLGMMSTLDIRPAL